MAWRHPGDKPLSEQMMVKLQTHISVTRPQWVIHMSFRIISEHRHKELAPISFRTLYMINVRELGCMGPNIAMKCWFYRLLEQTTINKRPCRFASKTGIWSWACNLIEDPHYIIVPETQGIILASSHQTVGWLSQGSFCECAQPMRNDVAL